MFEWIKGLFKKSASNENEMVWQPGIIPGVQIGTAFSEIPEVNQSVLFIAQNATQAELGFFAFKDTAELYRDNATVRPVADLLAQPNPNMDFVPLDQLAADQLDDMVENIEYLKTFIGNNMLQLTVTTSDPGEGSALAANTIVAVV